MPGTAVTPVTLSGPTLVYVVVLPILAYLAKTVFESYLKWNARRRNRLSDIEDVLAEIRLMRTSVKEHSRSWQSAFATRAVYKSVLARRYAPYIPPTETDHSAYDKLRENVEFLAPATIRLLRITYDLDSVVKDQINDFRTEYFRDQDHERKIQIFSQYINSLDDYAKYSERAIRQLRLNKRRIRMMSWRRFLFYPKWLYTGRHARKRVKR